jgi:hypothetical protein
MKPWFSRERDRDWGARMKAWLELESRDQLGQFRFSPPRQHWRIDLPDLHGHVIPETAVMVRVPQELWLAFSPRQLQELADSGKNKEIPVIRWRHHAVMVGPEAQEGRDWSGTESPREDALPGDGEADD